MGAFAPAKTPKAIVDRLARELRASLDSTEVRGKFAAMGADPMPMSAAEFDDYVRKEVDLNIALVKTLGIKPEADTAK